MTSYDTLLARPGVPLYDLKQLGIAGTDPRLLFSWFSGNYVTDPTYADAAPEDRANPSRATWADPDYLAQQRRRLPTHQYRRLHLNLPGQPEGAAFDSAAVTAAKETGVTVRPPDPTLIYEAFVDMSGGSHDDAAVAIAHRDPDTGRIVVDLVMDQGRRPPFDPREAVATFARVCHEYRVSQVTGDAFGGETFRRDFEREEIAYVVSPWSRSALYEQLEPLLNAHRVTLPDLPKLEAQLLTLAWRGGKIDHLNREHDDLSNVTAGVAVLVAADEEACWCAAPDCRGYHFFTGPSGERPGETFADAVARRGAIFPGD